MSVFQHSIAMPGTLDFSVVIVSWNVKNVLQDCLESIFRLPVIEQPTQVIVVDNASTDSTVEMLRETFPSVTVIANKDNVGFAKANNQGIARANATAVLLLNPDTIVHPGALPRMLQALDDHPRAGIVGPKLLNPDGTHQQSVRELPTPLALAAIALKMRYWWPRFPSLRSYMAVNVDPDKEQAVGQVMGAAYLIRREVREQIGTLDEGFRIWFEEVDYCKRAAEVGWETWYVPSAIVTHLGGQSFVQQPNLQRQMQWRRSAQYYAKKHFSWWGRVVLWKCGWVGVIATWLFSWRKVGI